MSGLNLASVRDTDATKHADKKPEEPAARTIEDAIPTRDEVARFSCLPIASLKIGRFKFENGMLTLDDPQDIKDFRAIIENPKFPPTEKNRIKEIDLAEAERQLREMLKIGPKVTRSIDSSTGERAPNKQVGIGTLES